MSKGWIAVWLGLFIMLLIGIAGPFVLDHFGLKVRWDACTITFIAAMAIMAIYCGWQACSEFMHKTSGSDTP